jgi:hypothetical protein
MREVTDPAMDFSGDPRLLVGEEVHHSMNAVPQTPICTFSTNPRVYSERPRKRRQSGVVDVDGSLQLEVH